MEVAGCKKSVLDFILVEPGEGCQMLNVFCHISTAWQLRTFSNWWPPGMAERISKWGG